MAGRTPLVLPGFPCPDTVCRAAHGAADHPSPVHAAELSMGAGRGAVIGAAEPRRAVPDMELEKPAGSLGACQRGRGWRLDGPHLGAACHAVARVRCRLVQLLFSLTNSRPIPR